MLRPCDRSAWRGDRQEATEAQRDEAGGGREGGKVTGPRAQGPDGLLRPGWARRLDSWSLYFTGGKPGLRGKCGQDPFYFLGSLSFPICEMGE